MSFLKSLISIPVRNSSFFPKQTSKIVKEALNHPKKVGNAYTIFYSEKYSDLKKNKPEIEIGEAGKSIGAEWNSLGPAQKQSYLDRAKVQLDKYKSDVAEYKESLTDRQKIAYSLINMNRKADRGVILTRRDLDEHQKEFINSLPESHGLTGCQIFVSKRLKGNSSLPGTQSANLTEAMEEWSNLPESKKQEFENQAKVNLENYKAKIIKFLQK